MLRYALTIVLALLVAGVAIIPASAQSIFRYRSTVSAAPVDPNPDDTEIGDGNDVRAWFVAPVGHAFSKGIPVTAKVVSEWAMASGTLPSGLSIDAASGAISGIAERVETTSSTWGGLDAAGNRIARAEIHFTTFDPVGQPIEVDWYAHTGEYFHAQVPVPEGASVVRWEPIIELPAGMAMRAGAFEGRPSEPSSYAVAWRGYDGVDRETAFAYGTFLVEDGPVVGFIEDRVADKALGEAFEVLPTVSRSVGSITWSLKPIGARPPGLSFNSSNGYISGVFATYDTITRFVLQARDNGTGHIGSSNEFTLTTLPEWLDLSDMSDLEGVVGQAFERRIAHGSANVEFGLVGGTWPSGIWLSTGTSESSSYGVISGIPTQPETREGLVLEASGEGVEATTSRPFAFRVVSEPMRVAATPLHARVGTAFATVQPIVTKGVDPPYAYSSLTTAPAGLTFDASTGTWSSNGSLPAGDYDQRLAVLNAGGREAAADQIVRIYDPLTLAYPAGTTGARLSAVRVEPTVPALGVRDPAIYALVGGALPTFLSLDPASGAISGTPQAMSDIGEYGPFEVAVVDGFGEPPVRSNPFVVTIADRPDLEIVLVTPEVQRFVGNDARLVQAENAYEGVTFSLADRGELPPTFSLHPDGFLIGSTEDPVGTVYDGIAVHAVDGVGYEAELTLAVTVVEPSGLESIDGSLDRTIPWTVGRDLVGLSLPRVGNAYGAVTYEFGTSPFPLSVDQSTLALSGRPAEVGTFEVPYSVHDETARPALTGTLTFVVQPPMTVAQGDVVTHRGRATSITPLRRYGVAPFRWDVISGRLPSTGTFPAMALNPSTGAITGKPREEGSFPLTLSVVDATGQREEVSFVLTVDEPLPFSFDYAEGWGTLGRVFGMGPSISNQSERVEWTHVSGRLPAGVGLVASGRYYVSQIRGVPWEDGVFDGIVIRGRDTGTGEEWTDETTLNVVRSGRVGLPTGARIRHRADGTTRTVALGASNVTPPVTYDIPSNPYPGNVSVDPATGAFTVAFPTPGTRVVPYRATDRFGRTGTTNVVLDMVGPVDLSAPASTPLRRYSPGAVPLSATNLIGAPNYSTAPSSAALPSGLSVSGAAISGTPDTVGMTTGIVARVVDGYDGTSAVTGPLTIDVVERLALGIAAPDYEAKRFGAVAFVPTATNAVGPLTWYLDPVTGLSPGLVFDPATGRIAGSSDGLFEGSFTLTAVDSKGGSLGTAEGTFALRIVERDPPMIVTPPSLVAVLNRWYRQGLAATNVLGTTTWQHVSGTLPPGLSFDAASGAISGTPTAFGTFGGIVVRVTDTHRGHVSTAERTVSIDVRQDGSPIEISVPEVLAFRVGQAMALAAGSAENLVGDATWSAPGLAGTGLSIDPRSGEISGTATTAVERTITVEVTDVTERTVTRQASLVVKGPLGVSFSSPTRLTYFHALDGSTPNSIGTPVAAVAPPAAATAYGAEAWSIDPPDALPDGLTLDAATGRLVGYPLELGTFGPFALSVTDALPGEGQLEGVTLEVAMNADPIDLVVADYATKVGYPIETPPPTYGNALGDVAFFADPLDIAGTGLSLDPDTGILTGTMPTSWYMDVNVSITDSLTRRVTSRPLRLTVMPHLVLTAPEIRIVEAGAATSVSVVPTNVAGTLEWLPVDEADLPEGMAFDTTSGAFIGTPVALGTFGPFVVRAVDRFHGLVDEAASNPIMIDVRPGSTFLNLREGPLTADGERIRSYAHDFLASNLDLVGIPESGLSWSWHPVDGGQLPPGLSLDGRSGLLSGTPTTYGAFHFVVTVSGGGWTSTREFSLSMIEPLVLTAIPNRNIPSGQPISDFAFVTISGLVGEPSYEIEGLPAGLSYGSSSGMAAGTTNVVGQHAVAVTVTDSVDGESETIQVVLSVFGGCDASAAGTLVSRSGSPAICGGPDLYVYPCNMTQTWNGTACVGTWGGLTGTSAVAVCANLGTGWRLPSVQDWTFMMQMADTFPETKTIVPYGGGADWRTSEGLMFNTQTRQVRGAFALTATACVNRG